MKYTYAQLAKEARRESYMRRKFYPKFRGGLTSERAGQIDMMDHIAVTLERLAEEPAEEPRAPENVQGDFLGGVE